MPRACLEPDGGEDLMCHVQAFEFHPEGMGTERRPESREQGLAVSGERKRGEHIRREVGPHGRGCYRTGQREVLWDVVVRNCGASQPGFKLTITC